MAALSHLFRLLCVRLGGARARLCAAQFPQLLQRRLNRSGPPRAHTLQKHHWITPPHVNNHTITLHTNSTLWRGMRAKEKTLKSACRIQTARISKVLPSQGEKKIIAHSAPRAFSVRFRTARRARGTPNTFLTTHFRLFVATSRVKGCIWV
jgi:hypothetical protein